ncbi:hypothetical protein MLD38_026612 [Melastoma candidum]|uniref:Uncharacterized protein n=1 Tax=Melastoma candidum TaxID=119954 RepID=A0ACB9P0H5_9MYRT|nr:hypothetical protein MLD38_026612 [Melastoma candidum]
MVSSTIIPTIPTPPSRRHATTSLLFLSSRISPTHPPTTHICARAIIGSVTSTGNSPTTGGGRRDDAPAADGLARFPCPRPARSLPSLPLRLQVLHPSPPLLRLLQFRPYHPLMSSSSSSSPSSVQPPPSKTVRVVVKGRVQGVFYRNWTVNNALELGLKGWVRNRRDGSVEALFSGTQESVSEMEQRCRRGPPDAIVTGLQVYPCSEDPGYGFECRPTA